MPPTLPLHRRRVLLPSHHYGDQIRTFVDARVKWVRDRALDHAVEKEKHLQPFHALKDLLLLSAASSSPSPSPSPSPSLPLSSVAARRSDLRLPFRAIRFIRLFPSAFLEDLPSSSSSSSRPHPVIRPTPALLSLHDAELRAVSASAPDAASRLLRLLMLSLPPPPPPLLHRLRWDLGLPRDFPRSLLPDYPDFFRLAPAPANALDLELVCYSRDLAVSAMERYAARTGGYTKGAPLPFPLHFSRGFDLEKKVRNWLDEWQKLPYISPYENASHLPPKSDLAEKWTVGVLHEVLSLLISKKTEKENLVLLGEHLGLPPGFRKVIAHHPGIFYVSNKLRTQTVVLREAYRRDLLVEKHPVMGLRYQYIHLMHMGKEAAGKKKDQKSRRVAAPVAGADGGVGDKDEEDEDDDDDDDDEDDDEEGEEELSPGSRIYSEDEESDDEDGNDLSYSSRT
ncbi:Protein ROOT PRIMORDIUM DEFECTIVE 1 [Ananas comosus]|uniref:Protein ROOT PRIMORDIUM DEFECTIVE 1 n=1 Tax=Ananas comosus TaxID=4615 RepID=A0A199VHW2_ANACO|nr:Protein ROOT PRIMORDIUM DEFECTIVE 1 [Ananas comosus]